ncbi:MAG: hypothetical protein L0226_13185 [Acidobacteria bacterium]|nr:hypothetical protein [Acidobacteriota bacterium]
MDELLLPLLGADELKTAKLLECLIKDHAEPLIRTIVAKKLNATFYKNDERVQSQDAEDILSEVIVQILTRLKALQKNPNDYAIANFQKFLAVVTFNRCNKHLRARYPLRHRLKNQLRYLISTQPEFTALEEGQYLFCGLVGWNRSSVQVRRTEKWTDLQNDPQGFAKNVLADKPVNTLGLRQVVIALFGWLGHPVEFEELVAFISELKGIKESPQKLNNEGEKDKDHLNGLRLGPRTGMERVDQRFYLKRLWSEITELPLNQRKALLLGLRDAKGEGLITLLPGCGVASLHQIAEVLEFPAVRLAESWSKLPLSDADIGKLIGVERQKVINLRKAARERLSRRMRALEQIK